MFLESVCKDKYIVQVDYNMSVVNQLFQDVIHEQLECCRRVCESEDHYQWFKQPPVCSKHRFPLITIFDPNVIVTPLDVHLRKPLRSLQLVNKFLNQWQGVSVLDCHVVQLPIILYWQKASVLLLNKEEWQCHR